MARRRILSLLFLVCALSGPGCSMGGSNDFPGIADLDSLVEASELIVVASVEETREEHFTLKTVEGTEAGTLVEQLTTVRFQTVVKGDGYRSGDRVDVVRTLLSPGFGPGNPAPLNAGEYYVFFLVPVVLPEPRGALLTWGRASSAGIARMDEGELVFLDGSPGGIEEGDRFPRNSVLPTPVPPN